VGKEKKRIGQSGIIPERVPEVPEGKVNTLISPYTVKVTRRQA
jgi:hypothetical protein